MIPITIISGGQTGVDRAAMDFALQKNVPLTGYCPKGRKAEDGTINKKYPLKELNDSRYSTRTRKNIDLSDGILIIKDEGKLGDGTILTINYAKKMKIALFECSLNRKLPEQILSFKSWMRENQPTRLCIAGNRESQSPGIYLNTIKILSLLFEDYF